MQRLSFVITLCFFTLGSGIGRADLRFVETAWDAGIVKTGAVLSHSFKFVNDGPAEVQIIEARPSCGCTRPGIDKRAYATGEKGVILMDINTLGQAPGPQAWTLQVRYRVGQSEKMAELRLAAHMVREVTAEPAALVVYADHAPEHKIKVSDCRKQPLHVVMAQVGNPEITASVSGLQAGSGQQITLSVSSKLASGRLDETLHIYTDDPQYAELRVPLTIINQPKQRCTATPSEATIRGSVQQALPAFRIFIRDGKGEKVTIDKVEADEPALLCRWASGPGEMATLKVQVNDKVFPSGQLHGAIRVHIAAPVDETIIIPCHAFRD
jgi:hypothetical protein